jgi:hypothetical protein
MGPRCHILDGGIRRAGARCGSRRLVDAISGAQLWSETYARDAQPSSGLAVQDDVTDRVVATVADVHGVLLRSASAEVNTRPLEGLSAEELILRYWTYHRQHAPAEHRLLRDHLERFAAARPASATFQRDAGAPLRSRVDSASIGSRIRSRARRCGRGAAARRAESARAEALAFVDFFTQDRDAFRAC